MKAKTKAKRKHVVASLEIDVLTLAELLCEALSLHNPVLWDEADRLRIAIAADGEWREQ